MKWTFNPKDFLSFPKTYKMNFIQNYNWRETCTVILGGRPQIMV